MRNLDGGSLDEIVAHYEREFTTPEFFPEYNDAKLEQMRRKVLARREAQSMASRNAARMVRRAA